MAALTVVISHFSNATGFAGGLLGWGGGQLGVMLFFCLSGFLMGRLYLNERLTTSQLIRYSKRRIGRVVPLFLIMVLLSFGWGLARGTAFPLYQVSAFNIIDHLLFWRGVNVLWTVPVEVQFYVLFPVIWAVVRRVPNALFPMVGLGIVTVTLLGFPTTPVLLRYLPFFLVGVALSQCKEYVGFRGSNVLFFLVLVTYVLSFPQIAKEIGLPTGNLAPGSEIHAPWFSPLYMGLIAALLWLSLCAPIALNLLGNRAAVFVGTVSYSVYLLHYPILHSLNYIEFLQQNTLLFLPVFLASVLIVSWLSYQLIEAPLRSAINGFQIPSSRATQPV